MHNATRVWTKFINLLFCFNSSLMLSFGSCVVRSQTVLTRLAFDLCASNIASNWSTRPNLLSRRFRASLLILQGVNEPISRSKLAKSADSHLLIVCWLEALPCELQWYLLKQISEWSAFFTLPYYYLRHNRAFSCDLIDAMLEGKNNAFSWKTVSLFQPSNMAAVKTFCRLEYVSFFTVCWFSVVVYIETVKLFCLKPEPSSQNFHMSLFNCWNSIAERIGYMPYGHNIAKNLVRSFF